MSPFIALVGSGPVSAKKTPRKPSRASTGYTRPSNARKPFDASAKADIILRSSDSVDFFILKAILCIASPIFDNMFSTQESSDGESANKMKNGLLVVDLEEDSNTLYNLLILLYPHAKKPTNTLEVYTRVAEAAQKYAMDETLQKLKTLVMNSGTMGEEPVATFAVAMHFGWIEVMKEAALDTLAIPLRDLISGDGHSRYLHFIGVTDYHDLLSWRFACQDALTEIFASWTADFCSDMYEEDIDEGWTRTVRHIFGPHLLERLKQTDCARSTVLMDDHFVSSKTTKSIFDACAYNLEQYNSARRSMMKDIENALLKVPLNINAQRARLNNSYRNPSTVKIDPSDAKKPFDASAKADVILRSSDSVDFFVLKAILYLASPVFDSMFSITQESNEGESTNETKNGLPIVDLAEDSATLYDLLPQLYPYPEKLTDTLEVYIRVGTAAEKYAMDKVLQNLKKSIMSSDPMVKEPVATFAVAVHLGWVEAMREAAHNTLAIPLCNLRRLVSNYGQSRYLHFISAANYRDLISWRFDCQDVLSKIFTSWTTTKDDIPCIRRIFGPHLSKRLKENGSAQSTILMDDPFVPDAIMKSVFNRYTLWGYNTAREIMMKDIENALSKVPLKINGIVVQAGD